MILQAIVSGLSMGAIYALIALGYQITWSISSVASFAQGEFLMVGAMVGLSAYLYSGGNYLLAIVAAIAVTAVLGVLKERLAIRPLRRLLSIGWIMSTIGVGILLKQGAILIWGANQVTFPSPFGVGVVRVLSAGIYPQEIAILVVSCTMMVALEVFQRRSILGLAIQATSHNKDVASIMGVDVNRMIVIQFVISACLAGIGGVLIAPVTTAWTMMGTHLGLKAFAAAIIGGITSSKGCIVGGFILGVLEMLAAGWHSELKELVVFVFVILILTVRPNGLFGRPERG